MAFQDKSQLKAIAGTKMKTGETYEGYPVKFVQSHKYEGTNIIMKNKKSGELETFFTAGNFKYLITDGKIELGQLTRVTRLEDVKRKGKTSSNFKVEQDPDDMIEVKDV